MTDWTGLVRILHSLLLYPASLIRRVDNNVAIYVKISHTGRHSPSADLSVPQDTELMFSNRANPRSDDGGCTYLTMVIRMN